jgi:hypothetical protein
VIIIFQGVSVIFSEILAWSGVKTALANSNHLFILNKLSTSVCRQSRQIENGMKYYLTNSVDIVPPLRRHNTAFNFICAIYSSDLRRAMTIRGDQIATLDTHQFYRTINRGRTVRFRLVAVFTRNVIDAVMSKAKTIKTVKLLR